ncbi:MAG: DMT family transporter [Spirochaetaceae bacterium]|nr:MAG: DMT family transporter [Spirochaetaceae bacterium]
MGIIFAAIAALLYGSADMAGGIATRHNHVTSVLVTSQLIGLLIAVLAAFLLEWAQVKTSDLIWGAAAGLTGSLGLACLYLGIARGFVAITTPLAAVISAAVPVMAGVLLGETPGLWAWIGITIGTAAIFMLAWQPNRHPDRQKSLSSLFYGTIAGLAFGAGFILISRPSPDAGFWPIAAARLASVSTIFMIAVASKRKIRICRNNLGLVAATGTMDTVANIAFVIATRLEILPVVAVITALSPGPTVILGRIFGHEHLTALRIAGLILAIASAAFMSI